MNKPCPADLASVFANTTHVLLDFDGPVCRVFAGLPGPTIAADLRALINSQGVDIPEPVRSEAGAHDLLQYAATISWELAHDVEAALHRSEFLAIPAAEPTPGALDFLATCHDAHRQVAIVSNNPRDVITAHLDRHGISQYVDHIEGRDPTDPALMKPNPYLVTRAAQALHTEPRNCVLIGDATTDVRAAHAAGTLAVGYANKPGKHQALTAAGADAITSSMAELAQQLRSQSQP